MPVVRQSVDPRRPGPDALRAAVACLAAGEVIAFPTDTLYGLGVDPRRADAVRRLFAVKRRPPNAAVPLIAADLGQVADIGRRTPLADRLAAAFWPGALTLVLEAAPEIDPGVLAGGGSVAVRVPAHPLARALAASFGYAVTATSANRSGAPAAADATAVVAALGDDIALVLDGGPSPGGPPSTIVDARDTRPQLLREGAVAWSRVLQSLA